MRFEIVHLCSWTLISATFFDQSLELEMTCDWLLYISLADGDTRTL